MPNLPAVSFYLLVLAISLYVLGKSAEYLVTAVTRIGYALRFSQFVTGFLLLGIATSIPETFIAINSIIDSTPQLSLGNLLGANIVLLTLVAGLTAVLARGVTLKQEFRTPLRIAQIALLILSPVILLVDSRFSQTDGLLLITFYIGYLAYIYNLSKNQDSPPLAEQLLNSKMLNTIILCLMGLAGVAVSSKIVVATSLSLAALAGIPAIVVGLLILSVGTNLPELSIALAAVKKHQTNLILGDVLGSAATNTAIAALLGLFSPFDLNFRLTYQTTSVFIVISLLTFIFFTRSKNRLSSLEGALLLAVYIAYLTSEIFSSTIKF